MRAIAMIDDQCFRGTQPVGRARRVHCRIAAAGLRNKGKCVIDVLHPELGRSFEEVGAKVEIK
jgi:hypothetical protein